MAYATVADVRALTNIVVADLSDSEVTALIGYATAQINEDINTGVTREPVLQIDNTRKNTIDGSNTTFYVKNWEGKYIGDYNDDGSITTGDMTVYYVGSEGTETTTTLSSIDSNDGKFVVTTAPSTSQSMFINYDWTYIDPDTPSKTLVLATSLLVAAYSYEKINRGMSPQQVYGNVRFMRDMRAGNDYFKRYEEIISKINSNMGDWEESEIF